MSAILSEAPVGHHHRLGPFGVDADRSEYDEAIAVFAGATLEECLGRCQACHRSQCVAVAADTPVLLRLIELVGRGHTERVSLRGLGVQVAPIADLLDLAPAEREAALGRMSPEARISLADTAARLLVGVWMPMEIQAEAPASAAAAIQRVNDRYHLPDAGTGSAPAWAWAVLDETRPTGSYAPATVFALATTADPGDEDYLLGPITLERPTDGDADLILAALGWVPAWPDAGWREDAPGNGQIAERSARRRIMRVRRGALEPEAPVPAPYSDRFRWALESARDYPDDDSMAGPAPGRVRYALRAIVRAEHDQDAAPMRAPLAEQAAEDRQTVAAFREWLHDQIQAHGWPLAGHDFENLSKAVLAWVASDPDERRRSEAAERLAAAVAAGYADPAHLAALTGAPAPMPVTELFDVVCRCYREA